MAHTQARIQAGRAGARYLSLPEYSLGLLADPSLLADFPAVAPRVRRVADAFSAGTRARVTTALGTDLMVNMEGRVGNYCPGFVQAAGDLGSPPDIEANVSPVESASEGVVFVDGSIPYPGLGLLNATVKLTIRGGCIVEIDSTDPKVVSALIELFSMHDQSKTRVLAELGLGLNDRASLTGVMLTDEGAAGTAHFGFGSNSTVGGQNSVPFHLDFVFRSPSIEVDGRTIVRAGECLL